MVIASFNCEGMDDMTVKNLIIEISDNHEKNIILCLQETWRYKLSKVFEDMIRDKYTYIHESAMDSSVPRKRGRPYGGICTIISKNILYKEIYREARCISIILQDYDILLHNVYMPFNDSSKTIAENVDTYMQALSHISASQELGAGVNSCIIAGDVNVAPSDSTQRADLLKELFDENALVACDLQHYQAGEFSHNRSGRLIDRVVATEDLLQSLSYVHIKKQFMSSDHFPVIAEFNLNKVPPPHEDVPIASKLNWKKAGEKSLESYSKLAQKLCRVSLAKFQQKEIDGPQFYDETVRNLQLAANTCIPKYKKYENHQRHNVPLWRERMASFKSNVDFWLQTQFVQGGPHHCSQFVRLQLRLARSQFRRQLRILRREISDNVADHITIHNCHRVMFGKTKVTTPHIINGHNRDAQPAMWRTHYKSTFKAEDTRYTGNLFQGKYFDHCEISNTSLFNLNEINSAIDCIDTNKSYKMHYHWKSLHSPDHAAKVCLLEIFNCWSFGVVGDSVSEDWSLFDTNLTPIPKNGKKKLSDLKSWRPISIGTSENWILEKIFLARLLPFLGTSDFQFGYKEKHSASHAIELVRILERSNDCHVCMLDASAAFDTLSWCRIRDQLVKRCIPPYLVKLCLSQLISNRISVCNTTFIYPRVGIKQGGVLSGRYFSACYDDLIDMLKRTGSGFILLSLNGKRIFLQIIVYADDILLISRSPFGLKLLIDVTYEFSMLYNDLKFNKSKSFILRLGTNRKPPVSIMGIPVSECQEYLGVLIGRRADVQRFAAAKLFTKANVMAKENKELSRCSLPVKNLVVKSYGNVYSLETMLTVESRLRHAHRYLTQSVHKNWRSFADLPGPNIRSRRLYTVYELDSLEVLHRIRRNNFLIQAESSENAVIRVIIGSLPRITV